MTGWRFVRAMCCIIVSLAWLGVAYDAASRLWPLTYYIAIPVAFACVSMALQAAARIRPASSDDKPGGS